MRFSDSALRHVLYVDGLLLLMLAAAMAVPVAVDYQSGNTDWMVFVASAALTTFVGGLLALTCHGSETRMDHRAGYLLTVSAWIVVSVFASMPLYFSTLQLTFTDAFFETMSGLTTTGSTVLTGLDNMPPGLLLWRSLLQWIGGIGIVVMAIVLLPVLRVGGMQLFRTESSDISGKPVPRLIRIAEVTVTAYVGLTIACGICYRLAGMNGFDAINHAMATIATGGFSTKDASIGFYNSIPIEIVGIVFMTAGAFPLIWYARLFTHGPKILPHERQVPMFLIILLVATMLLVAWNVFYNHMAFGTALRMSAFNAASVLTDTGFATTDFSGWGSFAVGIFFVLLLIGGCAGSTAGAIKIFRWQILVSGAVAQLRRMISPRRVILVRYGDRPVDEEMTAGVRNFFFLYMSTLLVLSLLVMATGIDFVSSATAVAQAMANAGPGLGRIGGPAGNFSEVPNVAKWLLIAAMLLGRLELSTVYVMLLSDFWKR